MKSSPRRIIRILTGVILGIAVGVGILDSVKASQGQTPKSPADAAAHSVVVPLEEASFGPAEPYGGIQSKSLAVLWADAASHRFTVLVKISKGSTPRQYHTNWDMQVVVVKGTMTHWTKSQGNSKPLGVGSFWYQPPDEIHQNTCLTDECIMLVSNFTWGKFEERSDTN